MDTKLPPADLELYRKADEVLQYVWDPCGVSDAPQARDEYYGYLPSVFSLLKQGADASAIARHLAGIERDRMGMLSDVNALMPVAELLVEWREHLGQHS